MRVTRFIYKNLFYVPDHKKNLVSIRQWKTKVLGWHSSTERYVFENRIFKDAFTHGFKVGNLYQVVGSPLGTLSVDTSHL